MKRSEFASKRERYWRSGTADEATVQVRVNDDICAALVAGVTWDPEEEPKMLPVWGTDQVRLTVEGKWEMFSESHNEWIAATHHGMYAPAMAELRDRLMNEREEMEKMRNLGRENVYAGLPSNAREVSAPDQPTDAYRERTFWVRDPGTGKKELPVNAWRELELRRDGWVDDDPDEDLSAEELMQEAPYARTVLGELEAEATRKIRGIVKEELREARAAFAARLHVGPNSLWGQLETLKADLCAHSISSRKADDELARSLKDASRREFEVRERIIALEALVGEVRGRFTNLERRVTALDDPTRS